MRCSLSLQNMHRPSHARQQYKMETLRYVWLWSMGRRLEPSHCAFVCVCIGASRDAASAAATAVPIAAFSARRELEAAI
jgi:hypothetical protein